MTDDLQAPAMPEAAATAEPALPPKRPCRRRPERGKKGGRMRTITLRLSAEEREQAEQKANQAGLQIGAFFRLAALGHAGPGARRRIPVDVATLAKLQAQLGHIGGNINQIAKAINYNDPVEAPVIVKTLTEHRALVLKISALLRNTLTP